MEHERYLGHHEKTKHMNHGCRRRRGDITKGTDSLQNSIVAENFYNLKKEPPRIPMLTEQQTNRTKKETPPDTS
jgi:hypothetical protein